MFIFLKIHFFSEPSSFDEKGFYSETLFSTAGASFFTDFYFCKIGSSDFGFSDGATTDFYFNIAGSDFSSYSSWIISLDN